MATQSHEVEDTVAAIATAIDSHLVIEAGEDILNSDTTGTESTEEAGKKRTEHADGAVVDSLRVELQQLKTELVERTNSDGLIRMLDGQATLISQLNMELRRQKQAEKELVRKLEADLDHAQKQARQFEKQLQKAKKRKAKAARGGGSGGAAANDNNNGGDAAYSQDLMKANVKIRLMSGKLGYAYKQIKILHQYCDEWEKKADMFKMRCAREKNQRESAEMILETLQMYRISANKQLAEALQERRQLREEVERLKNDASNVSSMLDEQVTAAADASEVSERLKNDAINVGSVLDEQVTAAAGGSEVSQ